MKLIIIVKFLLELSIIILLYGFIPITVIACSLADNDYHYISIIMMIVYAIIYVLVMVAYKIVTKYLEKEDNDD